MKTWILTYGRIVILKREIEAPDDATETEVIGIAHDLEEQGELGIANAHMVEGKGDSWIDDIVDYEFLWEVEES